MMTRLLLRLNKRLLSSPEEKRPKAQSNYKTRRGLIKKVFMKKASTSASTSQPCSFATQEKKRTIFQPNQPSPKMCFYLEVPPKAFQIKGHTSNSSELSLGVQA